MKKTFNSQPAQPPANRTLVVSTIYDGEPSPGVLLEIWHTRTHEEAVEAVHDAVRRFAGTEAGQKALEESDDDFNWGDLSLCLAEIRPLLPNWVLAVMAISEGIVYVDHDEVLMETAEPLPPEA